MVQRCTYTRDFQIDVMTVRYRQHFDMSGFIIFRIDCILMSRLDKYVSKSWRDPSRDSHCHSSVGRALHTTTDFANRFLVSLSQIHWKTWNLCSLTNRTLTSSTLSFTSMTVGILKLPICSKQHYFKMSSNLPCDKSTGSNRGCFSHFWGHQISASVDGDRSRQWANTNCSTEAFHWREGHAKVK